METQMDRDRRSVLKATSAIALAAALPLAAGAQTRAGGGGLKDLNQLDAGEIAKRVARREISPVEVIDAALTRLDETHPAINAFTAVDAEGARRAARAAEQAVMRGDPLGPLHGVPVSVKDLIDVAGLPARYGSLTMKDNIARADAPSVERLRGAGAIILGKTATPEFGYQGQTTSLVHGVTRNPWNTVLTPGGSSGGAVASVAAGVTPIALGTDGGGSLRNPAALTGLVAIKANFGRVPVWPAAVNPLLLYVGPIARNVADAVLMLNVIAGSDHRDPFSLIQPIGREPDQRSIRELRVAFSPTMGYSKVDEPVERTVSAAIEQIRPLFPNLVTVTEDFPDVSEIHPAMFFAGISARLGDLVDTSPSLIDPPLLAAIKRFRAMNVDKYTRLLSQQFVIRDWWRQFFERYDLLLTPMLPFVAYGVDQAQPPGHVVANYFSRSFNHTGQPAASIPCGLTTDHLPVGLQVVAPLGDEARLIAAARVIEATLPKMPTPVEIRAH
jgi:Asp-tRNA(Asn)/Glu-tRNA(Gln) amidotransferase A subunit family amidase